MQVLIHRREHAQHKPILYKAEVLTSEGKA